MTATPASRRIRVVVAKPGLDGHDRGGVDDVLVTAGGTIPPADVTALKTLGVAEIFTPGASTDRIVEFIRRGVRQPGHA